MRNIIRALNYQTRNDLVVIISLLFFGIFSVISPLINYSGLAFSEMTGSMYAVSSDKSLIIFLILIITTRICGWDQSDKTINYEIFAGHNRMAVYFGRITASFIWVVPVCAVLMFVPMGVCTAINGWGYSADFSGIMLHYLLVFLPIFRLVCEFALLSFLLKNGGASTILGFILVDAAAIADSILSSMGSISLKWQLGTLNFMCLSGFLDYSYGYADGEDVMVFDTSIESSFIIGTVAASLLVGAACLVIGSIFFKKTDMK
ncbi:MAG: hypothetical protein ACI4JK_07080 [Oscillospiraceae bacterium]